MSEKRAVIIGAGPAGLTAAYELLKRSPVRVAVLEKSEYMGGISRTVKYRGNRIDIGGHRFFSQSAGIMRWWLQILPLDGAGSGTAPAAEPGMADRVMLLRHRKSRIYHARRFFDYPIRLSAGLFTALGLRRMLRIGATYAKSVLMPLARDGTLEAFFINRFGSELYRTFFKSYTEKVWGLPCSQISADWGAQRVQGLSVWTGLVHALKAAMRLAQNGTDKTLIDRFLYPKYGPGQMWEEVARCVREMGGEIRTRFKAEQLITDGWRVRAVRATDCATGRTEEFEADYVLSTAPVGELVRSLDVEPPGNVTEVSDGLSYRNFITVGLLVRSLKIRDHEVQGAALIRDNWIYIHDPGVSVARLQIFNNWSPFLPADPSKVWLGLEYFCGETDPIWNTGDGAIIAMAREELRKIGFIDSAEVIDGTVLRMEKAYPAYCGTYGRFAEVRGYLDRFENLFLIGRNGMHRYNNQDHSMLTAMAAVDCIVAGSTGKSAIWAVNP